MIPKVHLPPLDDGGFVAAVLDKHESIFGQIIRDAVDFLPYPLPPRMYLKCSVGALAQRLALAIKKE